MIKEVTIDTFRWEFGNAISCGFLFPYNLRLHGWKVHVRSRINLPKEWTNVWFDEFGPTVSDHGGVKYGDKRLMEAFLFGECKIVDFKPLEIPMPIRPIQEKYVVIIPTIMEYAHNNPHKLELCLTFEGWMNIADFLRRRNIKVISFGTHEACSKEQIEKIGDISFFGEKKDLIPNRFLKNQLEWMSHAETSIALGGSFHIAFTFNVPGMGYDGQMERNYYNITKSYYGVRNNIHLLPRSTVVAGKLGLGAFKTNRNVAKDFYLKYSDAIIESMKEIIDLK